MDSVVFWWSRFSCKVLKRHTRVCMGRFDHVAGSGRPIKGKRRQP